jgi:glycosyltransferase involved in cell wall biosynthesis
MPTVSVIIPCYNHGQYLDDAVESVLRQTYEDFEIIVINDGSTDERTNELLKTYEKPKTRILHTTNQGLASARNSGITEARGRYILPLDADDRIGVEYLEQAVKMLDANPQIGIVYCKAEFFGAASGEWKLPPYSLERMMGDNIIFCSSLFRKDDWRRVDGYDPRMKYGWEDYEFWLSLLELGVGVYRIDKTLFYWRIRPDSMSRSMSKEDRTYSFKLIFEKHKALYENNVEALFNAMAYKHNEVVDAYKAIDVQREVVQELMDRRPESLKWLAGQFYAEARRRITRSKA